MGWYSTGPKIKEADLDINNLVAKYSDWPPVFVVCEVQPKEIGLPFTAYFSVDEIREVCITETHTHAHTHTQTVTQHEQCGEIARSDPHALACSAAFSMRSSRGCG